MGIVKMARNDIVVTPVNGVFNGNTRIRHGCPERKSKLRRKRWTAVVSEISAATLTLRRTPWLPPWKKTPAEVNYPFADRLEAKPLAMFDVDICVEADEFWSYVGNKSNQRWTWYALERNSGTILAHHNDKRTDAACQKLMDKLAVFPIR
jgi:hypothetical protein